MILLEGRYLEGVPLRLSGRKNNSLYFVHAKLKNLVTRFLILMGSGRVRILKSKCPVKSMVSGVVGLLTG